MIPVNCMIWIRGRSPERRGAVCHAYRVNGVHTFDMSQQTRNINSMLFQCWRWTNIGTTLGWCIVFAGRATAETEETMELFLAVAVGPSIHTAILSPEKTRHVDTMPVQCWVVVANNGPALDHHRVNISRLLGRWFLPNQYWQNPWRGTSY